MPEIGRISEGLDQRRADRKVEQRPAAVAVACCRAAGSDVARNFSAESLNSGVFSTLGRSAPAAGWRDAGAGRTGVDRRPGVGAGWGSSGGQHPPLPLVVIPEASRAACNRDPGAAGPWARFWVPALPRRIDAVRRGCRGLWAASAMDRACDVARRTRAYERLQGHLLGSGLSRQDHRLGFGDRLAAPPSGSAPPDWRDP